MAVEPDTLIIRHLPSELTVIEQEDLLRHFGAISVKCMGNKGRLKHVAFASFPSHAKAKCALQRLHQLEVLNSRLLAQYSNKRHEHHHPRLPDVEIADAKDEEEKEKVEAKIQEDASDKKKITEHINQVSRAWNIEYPYNPRLQYLYPPPNVSILTNIANALASVPKLYVQVLHLMNKMALPCPFGPVTPTPPLSDGHPQHTVASQGSAAVNGESSEESEIESDSEASSLPTSTVPQKRPMKQKVGGRKRPKLHNLIAAPASVPKSKGPIQDAAEVFEQPQSIKPRKFDLQVHLRQGTTAATPDVATLDAPGVPRIPLEQPPHEPATATLPAAVEEGGFGKLEPQLAAPEPEEEEDVEEEWGAGEFISSHRLRKGRLSGSEMRDTSVFRNYKEGEPTARLYIKNLAKVVTEKDLHYIFGRYVDWKDESHKAMFDIRLMQEGRMKGQAFVTLPTQKDAKDALRDTNAFVLKDKPMVVQFARSAKPKETEAKDSSKKK